GVERHRGAAVEIAHPERALVDRPVRGRRHGHDTRHTPRFDRLAQGAVDPSLCLCNASHLRLPTACCGYDDFRRGDGVRSRGATLSQSTATHNILTPTKVGAHRAAWELLLSGPRPSSGEIMRGGSATPQRVSWDGGRRASPRRTPCAK